MGVHGAVETLEVAAPDPLDEKLAAERPSRVGDQHREQLELFAREVHRLAFERCAVRSDVDRERADVDLLRGSGALAPPLEVDSPQHRPHAGEELAEAEGLDQVIVGAHLEAQDAVDLVASRRDHDDRHQVLLT